MAPKARGKVRPPSSKAKESSHVSGSRATNEKSAIANRGSGTEMENYFDKLKMLEKNDGDVVGEKAVLQLFTELRLSDHSLERYVFLWRFGVTRRGVLSRPEWVTACYTYGLDTISQLKGKITEWTAQVKKEKDSFEILYRFSYDYVRGEEERLAPLESTCAAWDVFFPADPLVSMWNKWLRDTAKESISRDIWNEFLLFRNALKEEEVTASEGQWPSLIVDFVQFKQKHEGSKGT